MKRILFVTLMAAVCLTLVFAQGGNESATNASFVPSRNIDWICTSSPGGGSDIFTRNLMDIMRSFPGMQVIVPSDARQAEQALEYALTQKGPVYIRLNRNEMPDLPEAKDFASHEH